MAAPKAAGARGQNRGNGNSDQDQVSAERQKMFAQFRQELNSKRFRDSVAAHVPEEFRSVGYVDRLIESIFVATRDNMKLLTACDRASLFRAAERIAKKGLTVGDNVAWLVPYNGQVQDQLGYKGAMIQVRRSGLPIQISTQAVFANDPCKILLGTDAKIEHTPFLDGDRGPLRGCYAFAKYLDTKEVDVEWMGWDKIDEIRNRAPSSNSPAWRDFPDEMGRKIPLKRICKRLPTERVIDLEDMDDRMSKQIEGVATHIAPAAIAAPAEEPITVNIPNDDAPQPETVPAHVASGDAGPGPSDSLFPAGG